ncbi:MAG: YgiT-type zinc finger protein [bacterium]|nr:YgiT-type zinc finger protein [bacterium]
MKCSIRGCPGEYEDKMIIHTVQHEGQVLVFEHVPAEVCTVCGDTLLVPETIRHIEFLLKEKVKAKPEKMVPLFEYA